MPAMDWIEGSSPAAHALEGLLGQVAGTDVPVLLQGESGSGKSSAAREIHRRSGRHAQALLETQLSTLAPTLIESELFGHASGAFTGAQRARAGRFQRAGAGTIVLDGIETLAEELQVKLLRVLQERVVEPVGSEEVLPQEARVIATSGVDLREAVRAGRFRGDLYFRLAVVVIEVPPLRARGEDLALFAARILELSAARLGVAERPLSAQALARLAAHRWPGNLRELENALERVLVLGAGRSGEIEAAEFEFLDETRSDALLPLARTLLARGIALPDFERALFAEALRESRGNVSAAARALGLSRKAFEHRQSRAGGSEDA
jgi:two-component system C4-dicarboxylate transport response regulator DctD